MDYWQTFKVKSAQVDTIKQQLKALEKTLPYGFGKKFGNYEIYITKKPRVSEISIGVHAPAMMVSLQQSWEEFNTIRQSFTEKARVIGAKVEEIMLSNNAWKVD